MNEEEIKVQYVLPWLSKAGIALDEIRCETSFSLRIGRQTLIVDKPNRSKLEIAGGRLDILVTRNARNLFVVETKAEHVALTDADRDQAVSYARLVHPIAPYAVVTNGRETRLYETLTKTEVHPGDIQRNGFELTLPADLVEEAQRVFLQSSPENLRRFFRAQVDEELGLLMGNRAQLDRKYIPDLHVARQATINALAEHSTSPLPGLLISAPSGAGKSCDMCWIAEQLLAGGKPVLFFNGALLEGKIVDAIAAAFAWTFGAPDNEVTIFKRLILTIGSAPLTIIIDAIDEWAYGARAQHLSAFLGAANSVGMKVIVSCKDSAIDSFLRLRGLETYTSKYSRRLDLPTLSWSEFFRALERYRDVYNFRGLFESGIISIARENPFLLRVLFDAAHNAGNQNITFDSPALFDQYIKRAVERTSDSIEAMAIVVATAEALYKNNSDWICLAKLSQRLPNGYNTAILTELTQFGILTRGSVGGEVNISFYFQQMRDYLIAFHALHFQRMSVVEFEAESKRGTGDGMWLDVMGLYYRMAPSDHRRVLDQPMYENAEQLLRRYLATIDADFPALRSYLEPGTEGAIGIVGELDIGSRNVQQYGFRKIANGDEIVHFVPILETTSNSNLSYLKGADTVFWARWGEGLNGVIEADSEVAEAIVFQLRKLVATGCLSETGCPELASEWIVRTIENEPKIFAALIDPATKLARLPLQLSDVLTAIQAERLRRYYEHELVNDLRRTGAIEETWNGSMVSYHHSISPAQRKTIETQVQNAMSIGPLPDLTMFATQLDSIEINAQRAIRVLRPSHTIGVDSLLRNEVQIAAAKMSDKDLPQDAVDAYIGDLYAAFLRTYKTVVETNFPTVKQYLPFYASLPIKLLIEAEPDTSDSGWLRVRLYELAAEGGVSSTIVAKEKVQPTGRQGSGRWEVSYQEGTYEMISLKGAIFYGLLKRGYYEPAPRGLVSKDFVGMRLRSLVYGMIAEEFGALEAALKDTQRGYE